MKLLGIYNCLFTIWPRGTHSWWTMPLQSKNTTSINLTFDRPVSFARRTLLCGVSHKVCHPRCVFKDKLGLCVYLSDTTIRLKMYIYYIKSTARFGPIFIGHLQVDNWKHLVNSYTRFFMLGVGGWVGMRSRMLFMTDGVGTWALLYTILS